MIRTPPPKKREMVLCVCVGGEGGSKLKRTQASKPLAKALWALAKALSKNSARNTSLSEP